VTGGSGPCSCCRYGLRNDYKDAWNAYLQEVLLSLLRSSSLAIMGFGKLKKLMANVHLALKFAQQ
jgi:hypothetical protein